MILPAYNEEVSIGSIVLLTKLYADKVIVVDDGSSDRTAEIARKAGAEVIVHEKNTGKGSSPQDRLCSRSRDGCRYNRNNGLRRPAQPCRYPKACCSDY